jgi:hypothetical protein
LSGLEKDHSPLVSHPRYLILKRIKRGFCFKDAKQTFLFAAIFRHVGSCKPVTYANILVQQQMECVEVTATF